MTPWPRTLHGGRLTLPRMKPASALLLIALPLALAGCGNKGPLVLPTPDPALLEVEPESGVPVETDTPDTLPAGDPGPTLPDPLEPDPLLPTGGGYDPFDPPIDLDTVPGGDDGEDGEGGVADDGSGDG